MHKNHFVIYDPSNQVIKLTYKEFQTYFQNIFIVFRKKRPKKELNNHFVIKQKITFFDLPKEFLFLAITIFFDFFILATSLLGSSLIRLIFRIVNDTHYHILFLIGFYFLVVFLLEGLNVYFISLYKMYKIQFLMKRNFIFYVNYLSKKSKSFFLNTKKEELYQYYGSLSDVISFQYLQKPSLISNSLFLFVLFFILTYLSLYYLIFALLYTFISLIAGYFTKKHHMLHFEKNNFYKNEFDYNLHNFYNFLENEKNTTKFVYFANISKRLFWKNSLQIQENALFFMHKNFASKYLKKVIYVVFVVFSLYFLLKNNDTNFNIAKIIFAITLLNLFNEHANNIFEVFNAYIPYKKNLTLLENFLFNDNKKTDTNHKIKVGKIKNITIQNLTFAYFQNELVFNNYHLKIPNATLLFGQNGVGKSTLLKILAHDLLLQNNKGAIMFNNIAYQHLDWSDLEQRIIYLPADPSPMLLDYTQLNKNKDLMNKISYFIQKTNLPNKDTKNLSKGEIQLLNLLNLITLKDHIILLDEAFSNVSQENIALFMELFLPKIKQKNYIICASHNQFLQHYFVHKIEIKNVK